MLKLVCSLIIPALVALDMAPPAAPPPAPGQTVRPAETYQGKKTYYFDDEDSADQFYLQNGQQAYQDGFTMSGARPNPSPNQLGRGFHKPWMVVVY